MYLSRQLLLFILAVVVFILFGGFIVLYQVRFFTGRASVVAEPFSNENSYIFTSPLVAKAGSQEKIRLTIFILDARGLGLSQKVISIQPESGLKIEAIQGTTDNFGKAVFDISGNAPGTFSPQINVDGIELSQKAKLTFN
jgi:hypothetical protein